MSPSAAVICALLFLSITVCSAQNLKPVHHLFNPDDEPLLGNGTRGRYLKEIGGEVLVSDNPDFVFTSASLIKTLIHAHALKQVQRGKDRLNARTKVYTDISGSCPLDSGGPDRLTLRETLRIMMMFSDNRHTQTLVRRYGKGNINRTARKLGLKKTRLRERIGCFPAAQIMPSTMTLAETGKLFEKVATRFLRGPTRKLYFELMVDFSFHLQEIVDTNSSIAGRIRRRYKKLIFSKYKDGFYFYNSGVYYRTLGAYVRLPVRSCDGTITRKEYALAAFVYKSLTKIDFTVFVDWTADAMREEIKKGLMTFLPC